MSWSIAFGSIVSWSWIGAWSVTLLSSTATCHATFRPDGPFWKASSNWHRKRKQQIILTKILRLAIVWSRVRAPSFNLSIHKKKRKNNSTLRDEKDVNRKKIGGEILMCLKTNMTKNIRCYQHWRDCKHCFLSLEVLIIIQVQTCPWLHIIDWGCVTTLRDCH